MLLGVWNEFDVPPEAKMLARCGGCCWLLWTGVAGAGGESSDIVRLKKACRLSVFFYRLTKSGDDRVPLGRNRGTTSEETTTRRDSRRWLLVGKAQ